MTLEEYYVAIGKCSNCMVIVIKHTNMYGFVLMYLYAKKRIMFFCTKVSSENTSLQVCVDVTYTR
jgi:hypothetical protein